MATCPLAKGPGFCHPLKTALAAAGGLDKATEPTLLPRPFRRVLFCLMAVAPGALAVLQLGRLHPDEVYQYLEPAYFRVHGYGVAAWEWNVGLRNWAYPLLLAALLRLCTWLGIDHPLAYRAVL